VTLTDRTAVLDLESMLAPIDGEDPAGPDLNGDGEIEIAELRSTARGLETAKSVGERDAEVGEDAFADVRARHPNSAWLTLVDDATAFLRTRSKDVQIGLILVHAAVRAHGFTGLYDGLRAIVGLLRDYGDAVHPRDSRRRAALVNRYFFGDRPALLPACDAATIVVADIVMGGGPDRSGEQVTAALTNARLRASRDAGFVKMRTDVGRAILGSSDVDRLIAAAGPALPVTVELLRAIESELRELETIIQDPSEPVVSSRTDAITLMLDEILVVLEPNTGMPENGSGSTSSDASAGAAQSSTGAPRNEGGINSRAEAFMALERIAHWFDRNEPQSTVPYDLRRAIRRGKLTLDQLVRELMTPADQEIPRVLRDLGVHEERSRESDGG